MATQNDAIAEAARQYLQWVYLVEIPKNSRPVSRMVCKSEREAFDNLLEAVTGFRQLMLAGPSLGFTEMPKPKIFTGRIQCKVPNISNTPKPAGLLLPRAKPVNGAGV